MKTRILLTLCLVFSVSIFAQKKEVKAIEKAVKSANYAEAKSAVSAAESLVGSMDAKTKDKFYLLKGQTFLGSGNKNVADLKMAAEAFNKAKEGTLSAQAQQGLGSVVVAMVNTAVDNQNSKNYMTASDILVEAHKLQPQDTSYLFFAGTNAINGRDYTKAASIYQQLSDLKYTGRTTKFTAVEAASGEKKDDFSSKEERDLFVKSGDYISPKDELTESRRGDIIKTLATLYVETGENERALSIIDEAIKEDPNDLNIIVAQANVYLKMERREDFFNAMKTLIAKDPNNAVWHFNLGIGNAEAGNAEEARVNYEKAIELDPKYVDAYNNIAIMIITDANNITEEMNGLGTSSADFDRYDKLKVERQKLYEGSIPYLDKGLEADPEHVGMTEQLYQVHQVLGNQNEADAVKARLDALSGGL